MKRGQQVIIYEDPVTEQKPEGIAILVKQLPYTMPGYERWTVRFPDEPTSGTYERTIKIH